MKLLDLTLATGEENLALDEALLETAESSGRPREVLRIWESPVPVVVIGRASRVREEVNVSACAEANVPILRRHSGGSTIVAGPGCLMYAVVLSYQLRPELQAIDQAHRFVLGTISSGLNSVHPQIEMAGTSDLTLGGHTKFSGNALRCCRTHLLYHGTLLYDFDLELIGRLLLQPPRQPDYRQQRSHLEFVDNLPASQETLRAALINAWCEALAVQSLPLLQDWPKELTEQLARDRYGSRDWNWQR